MATAREQAREATKDIVYRGTRCVHPVQAVVADMTSDIWEPIVRRLFAELSLARRYVDDPDGQASIGEALHTAKEALGREETS